MTISTSTQGELTVGGLVELAYHQSGLLEMSQTPSPAQRGFGRKRLQLMLRQVEVDGCVLRVQTTDAIDLTKGKYEYSMSEWVSEVFGNAQYVPQGQDPEAPTSSLLVRRVGLDERLLRGNYNAESWPSEYSVLADVQPLRVKIWPPPNEDGTMVFRVTRLLAETDTDDVTFDIERHWHEHLLNRLCGQIILATGGSLERATNFFRQAERDRMFSIEAAGENVHSQIYLDHHTSTGDL